MFWLLWICALWIVKNFGKLLLLLQELVRAQRLALITTVSANTTREVVAMAIPCSSCCFYMFLLRRYRRRAKTEASPSPAFQRISSTPATFRGRIYKVRAAQVPVNWFWHVLALLSDENPSCFWVHSASSLEFPSQILIDHESLGGVTIPNCLNLRQWINIIIVVYSDELPCRSARCLAQLRLDASWCRRCLCPTLQAFPPFARRPPLGSVSAVSHWLAGKFAGNHRS